MPELETVLIGQAIAVVLGSFLNAVILVWRARKLRAWVIRYRDAYLVAIEAGVVALIIGDAAIFIVSLAGGEDEVFLASVGLLVFVGSWWYTHSNALLKLADPRSPLSDKDIRAITVRVFGDLFAATIVIGVLLLLIFIVADALK